MKFKTGNDVTKTAAEYESRTLMNTQLQYFKPIRIAKFDGGVKYLKKRKT